MAYTKNTWKTDDIITAEKLNNIENGISSAENTGGSTTYIAWSDSYDGALNFSTTSRSISRNLIKQSKSLSEVKANSATITTSSFDTTTNMIHIVAPKGSGSTVGVFIPIKETVRVGQTWSLGVDILNTTNQAQLSRFYLEASTNTPQTVNVSSSWQRITSTGRLNGSYNNIVIYFDTTDQALDLYIKQPKLAIETVPSPYTPSYIEAPYYNGNRAYIGICYSDQKNNQPTNPNLYTWSPANDVYVNAQNITGVFDYLLIQSQNGVVYKETIDDSGNVTMTKQ